MNLLAKIRQGEAAHHELEELYERCSAELSTSDGVLATKLYAVNAQADFENAEQLRKLPGVETHFNAEDTIEVEESLIGTPKEAKARRWALMSP